MIALSKKLVPQFSVLSGLRIAFVFVAISLSNASFGQTIEETISILEKSNGDPSAILNTPQVNQHLENLFLAQKPKMPFLNEPRVELSEENKLASRVLRSMKTPQALRALYNFEMDNLSRRPLRRSPGQYTTADIMVYEVFELWKILERSPIVQRNLVDIASNLSDKNQIEARSIEWWAVEKLGPKQNELRRKPFGKAYAILLNLKPAELVSKSAVDLMDFVTNCLTKGHKVPAEVIKKFGTILQEARKQAPAAQFNENYIVTRNSVAHAAIASSNRLEYLQRLESMAAEYSGTTGEREFVMNSLHELGDLSIRERFLQTVSVAEMAIVEKLFQQFLKSPSPEVRAIAVFDLKNGLEFRRERDFGLNVSKELVGEALATLQAEQSVTDYLGVEDSKEVTKVLSEELRELQGGRGPVGPSMDCVLGKAAEVL